MIHELIAQYGITALTWALAGITLLLGKYVLGKIKNDTIRGVSERLWDEVRAAALEVGQVFVDALRDGKGQITDKSKAEAKAMALAKLKSNIGKPGLAKLVKVLGVDDIDSYLGNKIEAFLGSEKSKAKAAELPKK